MRVSRASGDLQSKSYMNHPPMMKLIATPTAIGWRQVGDRAIYQVYLGAIPVHECCQKNTR
jgi:hypothetical protein